MTVPPYFTTYKGWIDSYEGNCNTGVDYEIRTGLSIMLGGGIIVEEDLPMEYRGIQPYKMTSDQLLGLFNITQTDNIGGSGDIGKSQSSTFPSPNGTELSRNAYAIRLEKPMDSSIVPSWKAVIRKRLK